MFGFSKGPATGAMTPEEVNAALGLGAIHLVDVREANEWSAGHIEGALHAPLSRLDSLAAGLPRDKPVILHCLSGGRSARALALCHALGLPIDTHMIGGISAWQAAGLPVTR